MTAQHTDTDTGIVGVERRPLTTFGDERGVFAEFYRDEWVGEARPVQWNVTSSVGQAARGVHVHVVHDDYVVVISGRMLLGLRDLRRGSETHGAVTLMDLSGDELTAVTIPKGVAHGFYFPVPAMVLVGVDHTYDPADELEVHWQDPDLGINWPTSEALLSDRDRRAGTLNDLLARMEPWQPFA